MHGRVWINFKELRAKLKFEEVLRLYHVEVRRDGSQHKGPCPLPLHTGSKGATAFSANLDRGIFQCFGCKAKGNVLDFACYMEGAIPADGNALRKVALKLQETLSPKEKQTKTVPSGRQPKQQQGKVLVNEPIDFALKDLDSEHPFLLDCGLTAETIQHFGLGYCSRGMLKGRIAIPLHDAASKLVGYAGALVDGSGKEEGTEECLFPTKRERNGVTLDFQRSLLVYNRNRIETPAEAIIVVEDFASVWWLHQNGFLDVVGLMGSDCSEDQAKLIAETVTPGGRVWVLSQSEDFGQEVFGRIGRFRFVRWVALDQDRAVTDLTGDEIQDCLAL